MNRATYEKLKLNPHYKISEKQKREIDEEEQEDRNPMISFGKPPTHNTQTPKHKTAFIRSSHSAKE